MDEQVAGISIRNLSKTFVGTRALDAVDLDIRPGEIHALAGGNGSGKSTLIKILSGVYEADPGGEIRFGDRVIKVDALTPAAAHATGLRVVHQDLGVFPDLSVAENLSLGHGYETGPGARVRWRLVAARTRALIERFEIPAKPTTMLRDLSRAAQTQVAIARALQGLDGHNEGLLILDEPTASLPVHEVSLLLKQLRRYAAEGQSILYVSHRLDEVLGLADRVTVLRDGVKHGTYQSADLDEDRFIELIVGRQVDSVLRHGVVTPRSETVLEVEDLWAGPLRGVNLRLARGEVLGIAGLLGSGRSELLRAIFGDFAIDRGSIALEGKAVGFKHPSQAIAAGIALVPENRAQDAAFLDLPLYANAAMPGLSKYWGMGGMREQRMRQDGTELMGEFKVKGSSASAPLNTLSGGNQQKVIMARWLRRSPKVLLLDEPTQGVDVGARADIYGSIQRAIEGGASAIVVASDLEELARVSDRAIVLRDGRIAGELDAESITPLRLTQLAYGANDERESNEHN